MSAPEITPEQRAALEAAVLEGLHCTEHGWKYRPSMGVDALLASPALRELLADAWQDGYDAGRDDESFYSRGVGPDPDVPHDNPWRGA